MHPRLLMTVCVLIACGKPPAPADPATQAPVLAPPSAERAPEVTPIVPDAAPAETTPAPQWVTLAPAGEGFAAELPSEPVRTTEPFNGPRGQHAEGIKYTVSADALVLVLSVSPAAVPGDEASARAALEAMMATQTQQPNRTTRYDKVLQVQGAHAREAEQDLTEGDAVARLRIRIYLRGSHMYQVLAIWPSQTATTAATVDRVFTSYRLVGDDSKLGVPAFYWKDHRVTELGLAMALPVAPTITRSEADTFLGKASITAAVAVTKTPMAAYSVERVELPSTYADKSDDALGLLWKNARTNAAQGTAPKLIKEDRGTLLGQAAPALLLEEALPDGKARLGYLRLAVIREGAKAQAILVASAWFMDEALAPTLADRFFSGLRQAP